MWALLHVHDSTENLLQLNSSLPSGHSALPEHVKWPGMQDRSLHWNWSSRHVMLRHIDRCSSSPVGQSAPPSHTQLLWMHVIRSLHWYSVSKHGEMIRNGFVQFWKNPQKRTLICNGRSPNVSQITIYNSNALHLTYQLIGTILTVGLAVTLPFIGDAYTVAASKIVFAITFLHRTVQFVAAVATIIVSIAMPALLNALPIGASEFIGATRLI